MDKIDEISDDLQEILGPFGRLLWHSKMEYRDSHHNNRVYFNANIYDSSGLKLWYGDVDLDRCQAAAINREDGQLMLVADQLQALVDRHGLDIFVTPEYPWRFEQSQEIIARWLTLSEHTLTGHKSVVRFTPNNQQER